MIKKFSCNDYNLFYINSDSNMFEMYKSHFEKWSMDFSITVLKFLFEIKTPFLMDGECKKLRDKLSDTSDKTSLRYIKQFYDEYFSYKKQKRSVNVDQITSVVIDSVKKKFLEIRSSTEFINYFQFIPTLDDVSDNNGLSRKAKEIFLSATDPELYLLSFEGSNESDKVQLYERNNYLYLIPPKSRYINGNVFDLDSYFKNEKFDLVLLDPPWINKHVRRRKKMKGKIDSYSTMSVEEVMKIPLTAVLTDDSLVLFWITNSSSLMEDLLQCLKLWDLEFVTTWYWLKVTKFGYPVISLASSSNGKLPYEKLLVTRRKNSKLNLSSNLQDLLFCSIPCVIHSHKPSLKELLSYTMNVDDSWRCLELFARSLNSHWTSLGNEVLKFQDISLLNTFTNLPRK